LHKKREVAPIAEIGGTKKPSSDRPPTSIKQYTMSIEPESIETSVSRLFAKIESLLAQTLQETGCGSLTIESEKISSTKIKVTIRGSTHYRYIISSEDINR
jgi:hypothetical protein